MISDIKYSGAVKRTQADEYVEITNQGGYPANLAGWRLHASSRGQNLDFPKDTILAGGASYRVYTNQIHPETGGFSFGSGRAIWKDKGDEGQLFDSEGNLVSTFSY